MPRTRTLGSQYRANPAKGEALSAAIGFRVINISCAAKNGGAYGTRG